MYKTIYESIASLKTFEQKKKKKKKKKASSEKKDQRATRKFNSNYTPSEIPFGHKC